MFSAFLLGIRYEELPGQWLTVMGCVARRVSELEKFDGIRPSHRDCARNRKYKNGRGALS